MSLLTALWVHLSLVLHRARRDDGAPTTEQVIWIAFAAGLALTITGLFRDDIMAAAQSVKFR